MPESPRSTLGDQVARALVAGFVGTTVAAVILVVAYVLASVIGPNIPGTFGRWLVALTRNPATAVVQAALALALLVHIAVGLIWALVYAFLAEPRLSGSGWRRGALFSLGPWVLSLVVFLPLVGGGFLGLALGAGPLPIIGNLILHLAYGSTLGQLYAAEQAEVTADPSRAASPTTLANLAAERGLAFGMVVAGVVGLIAGIVIAAFVGASLTAGALAGAAFGASAGALVGSFVGLTIGSGDAATAPQEPQQEGV